MLTFEQHDFELCGYTYMQVIFCSKDLRTGRKKKKKLKKQNCRGLEFDPWSGNLRVHMPCSRAQKKQDYLVCG